MYILYATLWILSAIIIWYLFHAYTLFRGDNYKYCPEPPFPACIICPPLVFFILIIDIVIYLNDISIGDKIKKYLDKKFGIKNE